MPEPWVNFCLEEVKSAVSLKRYLPTVSEKDFLESIQKRLGMNFQLTKPQENYLVWIHKKATEIKKIKRRYRQ